MLTKSGRNEPSIRPEEDLEFQARRAERGFKRLRDAAKVLEPFDPEDLERAIKAGAQAAGRPTALTAWGSVTGGRVSEGAEAAGDATVLGEDVHRFLGQTLASPRDRAARGRRARRMTPNGISPLG